MIAAAAARARAAIALVTVTIVLAAGLLARHHEAEVAHVTDARTGVTSHASDSGCRTETVLVSHFHALPAETHADVCDLTAALHQPVVFAKVIPLVTQLLVVERATAPPVVVAIQTPLLHAAPKTSPPAVA